MHQRRVLQGGLIVVVRGLYCPSGQSVAAERETVGYPLQGAPLALLAAMPLMLFSMWLGCTPAPIDADPPEVVAWCDPVGDPMVEIGVDPDDFGPVEDGDVWPQFFGPQGGYHLEPALLPSGLDVFDGVNVVFTAFIGTTEVASNPAFLDFKCNRKLNLVPQAARLFLDEPLEDDTIVTIEIRVEDVDGAVAVAEASAPIRQQ
jgi:hypothetical protein